MATRCEFANQRYAAAQAKGVLKLSALCIAPGDARMHPFSAHLSR